VRLLPPPPVFGPPRVGDGYDPTDGRRPVTIQREIMEDHDGENLLDMWRRDYAEEVL
jgi:hypothetical protein